MSAEALRLAREHYENFPVLTRFVPPDLRLHVASVYAFARVTDDLGDEGPGGPEQRLEALERWEEGLEHALAEEGSSDPVLAAVARTIRERDLPVEPFRGLIHANRLDQRQHRYATYADLLEYCGYSANTVGRIALRLFAGAGASGYPGLVEAADSLCTGLQLANHWQGLGEDLRLRDRLYVPVEDLKRFSVAEDDLRRERPGRAVRALVAFELDRTRVLLDRAWPLAESFEPGPRAVLRLFLRGGRAILDEIERRPDQLVTRGLRVRRSRALLAVALEGAGWLRS